MEHSREEQGVDLSNVLAVELLVSFLTSLYPSFHVVRYLPLLQFHCDQMDYNL